jgi:hypothetical protein
MSARQMTEIRTDFTISLDLSQWGGVIPSAVQLREFFDAITMGTETVVTIDEVHSVLPESMMSVVGDVEKP